MMKVLVITGGSRDEREISFISASNVGIALLRRGHVVEMFDFLNNYEALEKKLAEPDVIFPVLHGKEGEGGSLQEFLEKNNVKFVGSGSKACYEGWNKFDFKEFCKKNSIVTPEWIKLTEENKKEFYKKTLPFVIKPSDSGSSRGIYLIKSEEDRSKVNLENLLKEYGPLIVEEFIDGIEVTVGILGDKALPVVEIQPPKGEWFDYENKYSGRTKEIAPAPSFTDEQKKELQTITEKIHRGLGCRHYSRADFMVSPKGTFALEINTIPGLTPESLLPKAAKAAGISFEEMIDRLIQMAVE